MARETKQWTISLPPQLSRQAMRLARQECRTKSELVREALRGYLARQSVMHAAHRQLARNIGKLRLRSLSDLGRVLGAGRDWRPEPSRGRRAAKPPRGTRRPMRRAARASKRVRRR